MMSFDAYHLVPPGEASYVARCLQWGNMSLGEEPLLFLECPQALLLDFLQSDLAVLLNPHRMAQRGLKMWHCCLGVQ